MEMFLLSSTMVLLINIWYKTSPYKIVMVNSWMLVVQYAYDISYKNTYFPINDEF